MAKGRDNEPALGHNDPGFDRERLTPPARLEQHC